MSENDVKRQLLTLRSLFTEESLIISVVLDLGLGVEHLREPLLDGLTSIEAAIQETREALQAPQVEAEPGPTNGAVRSGLRTAMADAMGRVLGAMKG
jgi:hypothetical protein